MGLWDFWKTESKDYSHGLLEPQQAPSFSSDKIDVDARYVTVKLRKMRIVNVRIGSKKFYAAVHADIGLWHGEGKFVNFKQVIAPPDLKDVNAESLDRTIVKDQTLLGPTPFRGGSLHVNLALLSVKSADLAGPYLDVLSGLSDAAGVSYIKMAEPFLKPLTAGIDLLTGTSGASMREIQLVTEVEKLRAGVYVVARAPEADLDIKTVVIDKDYILRYSSGAPITKYAYAVFTIEGDTEKYDWQGIPSVKAAYDELKKTVEKDDSAGYPEALARFRRATLLSEDLIPSHARVLYQDVKAKMDELMGPSMTGIRTPTRPPIPDLSAFNPFRPTTS